MHNHLSLLARIIAIALLALAFGGLLSGAGDARADVGGVTATVTQISGPTSAAEPGDLLTYRYTVSGTSNGTTTNTRLVGAVDGGEPGGITGANATIISMTGVSGAWSTGECAVEPFTSGKEFSCTDATGPLTGISTVDAVVRVEPVVDDRLFPPACLVEDDGTGSIVCDSSSITLQFIDVGTPAPASKITGVAHTFVFRLADGVTCASDATDNIGTRSCNASDVTIVNFDGATCSLTGGPAIADANLANDTTAGVTINSATTGSCRVTLAEKLDPRTCTSACTGATFIDTIDVSATAIYAADADGDGVADGEDNCPNVSNANQANQDGDPIGDACEVARCLAVPNYWTSPAGDDDCDGYPTSIETDTDIGTDPNDSCADTPTANDETDDKWPADFNDNQRANTLDLVVYASAVNTSPGDPGFVARADLNQNGRINTIDLVIYATALNQDCGPK